MTRGTTRRLSGSGAMTSGRRRRPGPALLVLLAALFAAGCAGTTSTSPGVSSPGSRGAGAASASPYITSSGAGSRGSGTTAALGRYTKVLVVMEENQSYADVIGSPDAPYINRLARQFGTASSYDAGYPAGCPSLASYILLTSGSDHGICDDDGPAAHPLTGDNVFRQVAAAGQEWRVYAESMPAPCTPANAGPYLVRHTAVPYYVSERSRCGAWDLPMGTLTVGALHDAVTAGQLPALSLAVPDVCHDMHGGHGCGNDHLIPRGDTWLSQWIPAILAGRDYREGKLVVIITWDESSSDTDNHIPTIVVSPTTAGIEDSSRQSHCSTLRTVEDLLQLPAIGCAATAAPSGKAFRL